MPIYRRQDRCAGADESEADYAARVKAYEYNAYWGGARVPRLDRKRGSNRRDTQL